MLELDHVDAGYGAGQVLFGVCLTVNAGACVSLMGRNGMGKSTTVKVISRLLKHRGGSVLFNGLDMARLPSFKAAKAGIGLVGQRRA